jgi:hypothetical protein
VAGHSSDHGGRPAASAAAGQLRPAGVASPDHLAAHGNPRPPVRQPEPGDDERPRESNRPPCRLTVWPSIRSDDPSFNGMSLTVFPSRGAPRAWGGCTGCGGGVQPLRGGGCRGCGGRVPAGHPVRSSERDVAGPPACLSEPRVRPSGNSIPTVANPSNCRRIRLEPLSPAHSWRTAFPDRKGLRTLSQWPRLLFLWQWHPQGGC